MSRPAIGCIADDYTGGTDVAAAFRRQGLRTLLLANHGPIVAGDDLASAADALEEIEETAKLYLLLRGHAVRPVTDHEAQRLSGLHK
jgi:ribulose-5-phosphate 4-epimerase/fuculose-1-phosphate aldolase